MISVIVIFFNAEQFIQEAIESVFAQTYNNWELLLADDGSNDAGTEIARQYAGHWPGKVRYLEHQGHQNRGMSASRNLAIGHAKGEYVALLDADDVWFPKALEEQVDILESQPEAGMVYGPLQWWYSWTGRPDDVRRDFVQELCIQTDTILYPPRLLTVFLRNEGATPSGVLVRRRSIEAIGGFEETFRGMYEDQVFRAKICLTAPVFAASQCWYRYRQHPNSCCSGDRINRKTAHYHSARMAFLNWLKEYLGKQGVKDDELWTALQEELKPYRHPILFNLAERSRLLMTRLTGRVKSLV